MVCDLDTPKNLIYAAIFECSSPRIAEQLHSRLPICAVAEQIGEDASAYLRKDPAMRGDSWSLYNACSSFRAVLHYRLARAIDDVANESAEQDLDLRSVSTLISSRGKLLSGAEIHVGARIGRRFVLDHGYGTVIGETAEIGDDCYVLGGVTIGAVGISENSAGKRHPTIGCRVEIGAFARILGTVRIGDDVFIGSHCVITNDVLSGSRVVVKTALQVTRLWDTGTTRTALPLEPIKHQ
ncbi:MULTISPECIES: serine O-acetyltransferase [unclassified Bradyrhizobium]|uniref:serine O-acetyltransferase n=1 Tax=unclassified Bradyrhizobium TaxID=2631580 RepID=UPI002915DAFA|nr:MULTISPECIES: serine O-acetyltransferase [unclassified Bradyrhizobium]